MLVASVLAGSAAYSLSAQDGETARDTAPSIERAPPLEQPISPERHVREVGELYCGSCHRSIGNWLELRTAAEAGEGGLRQYMLDMAQGDIMPPSPWHRKQLIRILQEEPLQ